MQSLKLFKPSAPICASLGLPGSKSITNRALILAALAAGESELVACAKCEDSAVLAAALRKLGVEFEGSESALVVRGVGGRFRAVSGTIDIGAAGASYRFLLALLSFCDRSDVVLDGSARLRERPIAELVHALQAAGAQIEYLQNVGCAPLRVRGHRVTSPVQLKVDSSRSSQFLSALLLAAPLLESGLEIELVGEIASSSYTALTLDLLRRFGVNVSASERKYLVHAGLPSPQKIEVEADLSTATYFWGLAALSAGEVTTLNVPPHSLQPDLRFLDCLAKMGCQVEVAHAKRAVTVRGPKTLQAIKADMCMMPDAAQTLAVLAACAEGESTLTGLNTLRLKESDRIDALQGELGKLGVETKSGADWLKITGGSKLSSAQIATYQDHRMAMAFSILAARLDGISIEGPEVVNKSAPTFWTLLAQAGISSQ